MGTGGRSCTSAVEAKLEFVIGWGCGAQKLLKAVVNAGNTKESDRHIKPFNVSSVD
jgi:hypothetical protein